MPPAQSFVSITIDEEFDTPSTKGRTEFLMLVGVSTASLSTKELAERYAALAWTRHHIVEGDDPDEWASTLPPKMVETVSSLRASLL